MYRRELCFLLYKNINSKLDLFPDKLHHNKKGQGILKEILEIY